MSVALDTTGAFAHALGAAVSRVHLPGSAGYAELTATYNLCTRLTPLAVVEAQTAHDVAAAVRVAGEHGVPVGVQSTGHGPWATMTGAVLVATRGLDGLMVDPVSRVARIGAGVRWSAVLEAAAPHGLAPLCGSSPSVGVVGLLTGGGHGPLARTYGLSADRVLSFDVVTGDGALRRASATENPDLYWGLRGGKGTLGIVTGLELELVQQPEVYAGAVWFDAPDIPAVVRTWAQWSQLLPDEGTTSIAVMRLPAMPGVPPELAGRTTVSVRFAWTGDPAVGEEMLRAIRSVAAPLVDLVAARPYAEIGIVHSDPEDPMPAVETHLLLEAFDADAADRLLDLVGPQAATTQLMVEVRRLGGAVATPLRGESVFGHRDAQWTVLAIGLGIPEIADLVRADARRIVDGLAPWRRPGALPNFHAGSGPDWALRVFGEDGARRLREVSLRYDPDGVLLGSRNVRDLPVGAAAVAAVEEELVLGA